MKSPTANSELPAAIIAGLGYLEGDTPSSCEPMPNLEDLKPNLEDLKPNMSALEPGTGPPSTCGQHRHHS